MEITDLIKLNREVIICNNKPVTTFLGGMTMTTKFILTQKGKTLIYGKKLFYRDF